MGYGRYGGLHFGENEGPPVATPPEIFRRTSTTAEGWQRYTVTFSPTHSGTYTLGFNIVGSRTSRDSTIFLDDVRMSSGPTELFRSGFETPVIGGDFYYPSGGNGTATYGAWVFNNYGGVIKGNPAIWGSSIGAQEGSQRGFVQTFAGVLSSIKTASAFSLVAGQTYTVSFYQASRPGTIGDEGELTYTVTIDEVPSATTPPVITAPANITAEAAGPSGAVVNFTATAQDNVDGPVNVTASPPSGSTFPLGTTIVGLAAADAAGNTASQSILIHVRDTTAPVISSLTASSTSLWPPNHKMVPITLTPVASDAVGVASLKIIGATSNEPDNGLGDGDSAGDIEITGALTLSLRAERSGISNGRVYTITVEAKDAAGNASTKTVTVSVPKSQGGK